MSSIACIISSAQGFPLSRTSKSSQRPRWQSISRLVAFMMEIFPGKEDFQFSAGPSTYYSNIQLLDGGKSCFFVTVVSTLPTKTSLADSACGRNHNSVHFYSLARYIGVVTLVLFKAMMCRCSLFLESTMLQLISNSTYRDTLQDNTEDNEDDDGLDPLVRQTFEELPDLADALVMYEEHFLQQLIQSTVLINGSEAFTPHWFDDVLHYYRHRKNTVNGSSDCICSLHLVKPEAVVSLDRSGGGNINSKGQSNIDNSTHRNGTKGGSLVKIATICSSGSLERENIAAWDCDILTFAGVMMQKLGDRLCKENECLDDSNCRVLLRLHECSTGNTARGEVLVISLLTAGENTLVLSTSVSMDAEGILDRNTSTNTDSPAFVAVLAKHIDAGQDKHSLLLFTANVLQIEFREACMAARRAVATAFFCNGQGASPAAYKAALDATIVNETKIRQTVPTVEVVDAVAEKTQQTAPTVAVVDTAEEKLQQTAITVAVVDAVSEGITIVTPFDPTEILTPEKTAITATGVTTPTLPGMTTPTHDDGRVHNAVAEEGSVVADAITVTITTSTTTPPNLAVKSELTDAVENRTADEVEYIPCPPSAPTSSLAPAHGAAENTSRPSSSHSAKRPGRTLKLSDKHV